MPKVFNKHHKDAPPDAVYVGRPSKWGNLFKIGVDGTREECIRLYALQVSTVHHQIVAALKGKDLVCWCAPKPCHADILLEIANRETKE